MNGIEKLIFPSTGDSIISIVKTPLSDYIVIDRKHPTFDGPSTHLNYLKGLNSCTFCLPNAPISGKNLSTNITKVLMQQPNQYITEDWDNRRGTHIPSGTIKELLSESFLDKLAKQYQVEDQDPKYKNWAKIYTTHEQYKNWASEVVPEIIFNQLVRNSSPNQLKITHERYPSFVELNNNWIMIVNQGHESNCGFAPADAFLYRINDKEEIQQQNFFSYYNVHIQEPNKVKFKFLSGWETKQIVTNSDEVNKKKQIIKINIRGNPAIIYE